MKQHLYVYIPGFEYDSKGPLHIDAIHLEAIADNTKLKTFCYIGDVDSTSNLNIEGNFIYKSTSILMDRSTKRKFKPVDPASQLLTVPSWSECVDAQENETEKGRCSVGHFYDFITEISGKEHHIIGIHNTPDLCTEGIKNLNIKEHDGLFVVELPSFNTDVTFNFTFYSLINNSEKDSSNIITVGENLSLRTGNLWQINPLPAFKIEDVIDFDDKYIKILSWSQTYNPAISSNAYGNFHKLTFVPQYLDITKKNLNDDVDNFYWEVPVNAGMLVSNTKQTSSEDTGYYKLYKYDKDQFKHVIGDDLPCNNKSELDFYCDFYNFSSVAAKSLGMDKIGEYWKYQWYGVRNYTFLEPGTASWGAWRKQRFFKYLFKSTVQQRLAFAYAQTSRQVEYDYNLCRVDLSNFNYLYKQLPKLCIKNNADIQRTSILTSVDTIGNSANCNLIVDNRGYPYINSIVLDLHNIQTSWINNGSVFKYEIDKNQENTVIGDLNDQNNSNITIECKEKFPSDSNFRTVYNGNSLLSYNTSLDLGLHAIGITQSDTLYKTIQKGKNNSYILPEIPDSSYSQFYGRFFRGSYINSIDGSKLDKSLLNSKNTSIILLPKEINEININISPNHIEFPILSLEVERENIKYGDDPHSYCYWNSRKQTYRKTDNDDPPLIDYTYGSGFSYKLNTYYHDYFMDRYGFGQTCVGIPQMFLIDLYLSDIIYENQSNHTICPMIYYSGEDAKGWSSNTLVDVNVNETNLLLGNNYDSNLYELPLVITNPVSKNIGLLHSLVNGIETQLDSTFYNEERFVGVTDVNNTKVRLLFKNNTITLEAGLLYVLKLLTSCVFLDQVLTCLGYSARVKENGILYSDYFYGGDELKKQGVEWVFYTKEGGELDLNYLDVELKFVDNNINYYNIISGIGLYKVDLTKNDNNTQLLKYNLEQLPDYSQGLLSFKNYKDIYDKIIFPAAYCAKENVEFLKDILVNDNSDYGIENESVGLHHNYNCKYLPDKAIYDVCAFYEIPKEGIVPTNIETSQDAIKDQIKNVQVRV